MSQDEHDDRVRFVYAQVKTIAENLPPFAVEADVEHYHGLLDELVALGYRVERFRIDDKDIFHPVASTNSRTGRTTFRKHREVRFGVFDRQVKALLTYFELTQNRARVNVSLPKDAR